MTDVARGRVLLVDDDDSIRISAAALLDDEFHVRTAVGVHEALAIIDAEPIDVVITDFNLGDGTGEQVVRRTGATFTIVVTGWLEDPRIVALVRSNLLLVLCKPVVPAVLIEWVRHGLALASANRPQ